VTPQERQRPLIEFPDALVECRVRTPVENEQLEIPDAARQSDVVMKLFDTAGIKYREGCAMAVGQRF
jgi:hypothetical protein